MDEGWVFRKTAETYWAKANQRMEMLHMVNRRSLEDRGGGSKEWGRVGSWRLNSEKRSLCRPGRDIRLWSALQSSLTSCGR